MVGKQNWTLEPFDQPGHLGQTFEITGQSESHIAMSLSYIVQLLNGN